MTVGAAIQSPQLPLAIFAAKDDSGKWVAPIGPMLRKIERKVGGTYGANASLEMLP